MTKLIPTRALKARLAREEAGFTLVEVMIAAFILVLGSLAVFMAFSSAVKNVQRGRETQVAISVAQRELEKVRSLDYAKVSLLVNASNPAPVRSAEVASPLNRLNVAGTKFNLKRSGAAEEATLLTSSTGEVASTGTFNVEGVTGKIFRFVVSRTDLPCASGCTASEYKRVVIITWLDKRPNQSAARPYYELQSDFVSPI